MSEILQHRGLDSKINPDQPNSFESFRQRFEQNIEMDVFLLKDGQVAVLHNKDLGLTQEQVEEMTLDELEKIKIPNKAGGQEGVVPLFEESIFNNLDRGNGLVIELKASTPEKAVELTEKVMEKISYLLKEDETFLQHPEYLKQLGLHSFSVEALEAVGRQMEEKNISISRGLLWTSNAKNALEMKISATAIERSGYKDGDDWIEKGIEMAERTKSESIDLHWSVINEEVVKKAHKKGIRVMAWVVNDSKKAEELKKMGVDILATEK